MKLKLQILILLFLVAVASGKAQNEQTKVLFDLAGKSADWFEGFQKNTGKNEFSYLSLIHI